MLWLDKKYNQLLPFKTGTKSRVDIGKEADRLLKKSADSSIISIHNHPGSSAFSPEDLSVACKYTAIDTLQVVGHEGTRYYLKVGKGFRPTRFYIESRFNEYYAIIYPKFEHLLNNKATHTEALKELTHVINIELAKRFNWEYRRGKL
mgnify:CR=1 FL=1